MAEENDFTAGSDFISFGSPPPAAAAASEANGAGPSRSKQRLSAEASAAARQNGARASLSSDDDDDVDEDLMHAKEGRGPGRGKGKGKAQATSGHRPENQNKRGRSPPTGPRSLKEKKAAAERNAPWTDAVDWEACRDPAEMLNLEIDAYYRYVSPTKEEYEVRLYMIELITRAVHAAWPTAKVTPFGSWQTQLYLPQGDIDLVVSTDKLNEANKARLLAELARAMRQAKITDVVAIISKARVPIIKFVTLEGQLNVDISLNQTNGISAGKIINEYLEVLPGSRPLIMVVKAFLSQRSMNEVYTGGLGSYSVICLVLSFLQIHPKLRRGEIDPEKNLGTLLIEFLELYGRNFHYDEVGISLRRGGSYYSKRSKGWARPGQPFLLSIEDPQDSNNDIASGSFGIRQVKNTLAGAFDMLQARLFERAAQITARRSGQDTREWDPEEMSILAGVMGVTKKTQKHRQQLRTLHQQRRLQKMLDMPVGAEPSAHVQNYRAPHVIGAKRRSSERSSNEAGSNDPATPASAAKRRKGLTGAVMVDDTEVIDLVNDNESDEFELEMDTGDEEDIINTSPRVTRSRQRKATEHARPNQSRSGNSNDVIEVFPNRHGGYESVSHDSDELEEAAINQARAHDSDESEEAAINQAHEDNEEADSRYKVGEDRIKERRRERKRRSKARARERKARALAAGSAAAAADSDDSSIIAIDPRPQTSSTTSRNGIGQTRLLSKEDGLPPWVKRMSQQEKRDYWSAKGRLAQPEDPGFDTAADFVGLD